MAATNTVITNTVVNKLYVTNAEIPPSQSQIEVRAYSVPNSVLLGLAFIALLLFMWWHLSQRSRDE